VAQYWSDNAQDEVHLDWVFSQAEEPHLDRTAEDWKWEPDEVNLGDRCQLPIQELVAGEQGRYPSGWEDGWNAHVEAIPLFAAYCPEGADQEDPALSCHGTVALYRRGGDQERITMVGEQVRPWLEGVRPSVEGVRPSVEGVRPSVEAG
jgi:hypothetical protein